MSDMYRFIFLLILSSNSYAAGFLLSWSQATERTDGTPLTLEEIAHTTIHYGVLSGEYTTSLDVDPIFIKFYVDEISAGSYYVAMTTTDTDGRVSDYSNEVVKRARERPKPPIEANHCFNNWDLVVEYISNGFTVYMNHEKLNAIDGYADLCARVVNSQ